MRTILRNGLDRYEVLNADEPLRRGERLVRFASERGALEFLVGVGGPARRDLHRLADDDFAGKFSGVRGDDVPREIAGRVTRGDLKIAHVEAVPPRVRSVGGEFVVLEARDRLRRGESWVRVMDEATAIRFARLLSTLSREEQRRLIPVAAAVGGGSQREQTRSLSRLLRGGQIRIARLQTLTRAGGTAPPEPEMQAFGVADVASLVGGFVPVVSEINDLGVILTGQDVISGERVGGWGRLAAAVGILSPIGGGAQVRAVAKMIGKGHAFMKHIKRADEFADLGIKTEDDFARHIEKVVSGAKPEDIRKLERDRTAYWDPKTETVVIHDPHHRDGGTAFRARNGRQSFEATK